MAFKRPWVQVPYAPRKRKSAQRSQLETVCAGFFYVVHSPAFIRIPTEVLMVLRIIKYDFSICKVKDFADINTEGEFLFGGKTDKELSVVCPTLYAPEEYLERDDGWRAHSPFPFW